MAETEPNDALNDELLSAELLSAYVDGELNGEQLAQVEQRLRTDSAAQQLVDELRSLSTTLQAMPRESVGENLSKSVLQRVERTKLPEKASATGGARRWGWAAMALAAALLLMFVQPEADRDEQPLAAVNQDMSENLPQQPELRAATETLAEAKEESAAEEAIAARSQPAEVEVVVDELDFSNRAESQASEPIREVHVVLVEGRAEFDKMLASHGLVRVAGVLTRPAESERSREKSGVARVLSDGVNEQVGETSQVDDDLVDRVLVEGNVEQVAKLLRSFQADNSHSESILLKANSDKDDSGEVFAFGALSSRNDSSRLSGVGDALESLEAGGSSPASTSAEEAELEEGKERGAGAKVKATGRIRVLFVLHPAPLPAKPGGPTKPAAPTKKARSDEKVGGKAG
jgi:hypothetical protein